MDELTVEQLRSLARARQRAAQSVGQAPAGNIPPQSPSRGTLGGVADTIGDFNTGIGQALTLGFNDELSAGIAAPAMRSVFKPQNEAARRIGWALGRDREAPGASVPDRGMSDAEFASAQQTGLPVTNIERGGQYTRTLADSAAVRSPGARIVLD